MGTSLLVVNIILNACGLYFTCTYKAHALICYVLLKWHIVCIIAYCSSSSSSSISETEVEGIQPMVILSFCTRLTM